MEEQTEIPTESTSVEDSPQAESTCEFKKPVMIGRIGVLRKKVLKPATLSQKSIQPPLENVPKSSSGPQMIPPSADLLAHNLCAIPYKEPNWSGLCPEINNQKYYIEVIKSGTIVETIDLMEKPYFVFGRLSNCDIMMAHPSISRFHAVLQYKAFAEDGEQPCGWYVIDLGSTHGTFINKNRLKPNHYTRIKVGHHLVFGISTRTYIFMGPSEDSEEESELTVTEIKQRSQDMKNERERQIQEVIEQRKKEKLVMEKKNEEHGINWGMGEDAEEEPDLADNPYASTNNEDLYLTDPKKTLRGYFEREGHELTYDCEERGVGQFLCKVELPIDDARGRPLVAEVLHKGKKKEAVIQCALEACRTLDRAGLLRQAKHESRRRKQRDYSADDYYSSDEDTFLDRTGAVEKKREMRRRKYNTQPDDQEDQGPLTYQQLIKKMANIENKIGVEERSLQRLRDTGKPQSEATKEDGDSLDNFMSLLNTQGFSMAQKAEISNTKMAIKKLKTELSVIVRLADIARPADLPPLINKNDPTIASLKKGNNLVVYGKRVKLKEAKKPKDTKPRIETLIRHDDKFVEEMDSDQEEILEDITDNLDKPNNTVESKPLSPSDKHGINIPSPVKDVENGSSKTQKIIFGPMRPPENYVIPEGYYEQITDRDLPEITEEDQ